MSGPVGVMQIVHSMEVGGMERVVMHLCRNMDREKYRPMVACIAKRGEFADILENEGIPVFNLDKPPGTHPIKTPRKLARILRDNDVRVLHMHNSGPLFSGSIAAMLARVPVRVYTDHARVFPDRKRVMMTERLLAKTIHWAVAVSDETRTNLIRYLHIPGEKISVIPNGVDAPAPLPEEKRRSLRMEFGISEENPLVVTVARLEKQKAIDRLIEAAAIVTKKIPGARFLVVGGGSLENQLRSFLREKGLEGTFHLAGSRLDATSLLAAGDVFALSSNWEGLPMSLLEALALGKPAVCPNVGDVHKAIEEGKSGFLTTPGDAAAIADGLVPLLLDPEKRNTMGKRAKEIFNDKFGAHVMTRSYEALFEKIACR